MSVQTVADVLLLIATPVWLWFTVVYVLLERAGGLLRWGLIVAAIGLTQMLVRGVLTLWFGETFPGRHWLLLLGRAELAASGIILLGVLHYVRRGTRFKIRARRATGSRSVAPNNPSQVPPDH